ncbi:hypothetical protein ES288_A06G229600v1 [Gossypium darwinii]|uniref:NB-ARC domain-containing protein n=1 Tax=Gossypium darwinii TaxID=34276 RepID=A0A5D2GB28_GOSDA|nr:hypothetical protein ES288_A06G229600v1 [Gossypium darwinii]
MITEAEKFIEDGPQELQNLCLCGCASKKSLSSYKFGKKVAKMLQEINEHISKGAFEKVAGNQPTALVVVRPEERPIALESSIEQVWSCIVDKDVMGIIGIYGLGGVGKTTLLTQINNKFSTAPNSFDVVIWAFVSKDYDVGKIQDSIGENIGFSNNSWKNKSVDQKATDIYRVLCNKKFVVLLDDLWERVDLNQKVGIPKPSQESGSKLIFTARSLEVCGEIEARKRIKVECLEPEQAWELFQVKIGDETLNSHPNIWKLTEQVAERCGGLPLALIIIGRAMACKTTLMEWEYAIEMLKRSTLPKMKNEVFPLLKFSYDDLPNATMKCCLLYCCLYRDDYRIPKKGLVEHWFCEGLLNDFDRFSEAQIQWTQLLEEPNTKTWEGTKRMSIMSNHIKVLRETPKCPNLRTLFLGENNLQVISDGFFHFIPQCLDLSSTGIRELPIELKSLTKLKMLDLSNMLFVRKMKIPRQLISSFSKLQIFKLRPLINRDYPDEEEDNVLNGVNENLIKELKCLQHLNILKRFLNFNLFRCCIETLELEGFRDSNVFNILCLENMKRLEKSCFKDCASMEEIKIEKLLSSVSSSINYTSQFHKLSHVIINGCGKLTDTTWLIFVPNLRFLSISWCFKMEEILSEGKLGEVADKVGIPYPKLFLKLEMLKLCVLPELKSIYWDVVLLKLSIDGCLDFENRTDAPESSRSNGGSRRMKNRNPRVFCPGLTVWANWTISVLGLGYFRGIKYCCGYWVITGVLYFLPQHLPFPFLKHFCVWGDCSKLKKLPLNSVSAKGNHITIEGRKDWWEEVEWENEATRDIFLPSLRFPPY